MMFLSFRFLSFSSMPCLPIDLNLLYSAVVSMGILCVLFPTIATCLCPAGEPVPFSRILFPSLVLFSYDVPFLSFASMPCLPIDLNLLYPAVVSMRILCVFFPTSHVFALWGNLFLFLVSSSLLLSFSPMMFLSFRFLSFSSMPCLPIDLNVLYSAVVSMGILCVLFPAIATCLCPAGEPVPFSRILFPSLVLFS